MLDWDEGGDHMSDLISRQDAIRIVDGIDTWQAGWRGDAIESMKALPSAQPEQKGWVCPVCGRGLSPLTMVCPCNNGKGWEVTCKS